MSHLDGVTDDLRRRVLAKTETLTHSQRAIAGFLTDNGDKAAFMTVMEIGKAVGVSESSVVRFAYVLGYEGYPPLRAHLQDMVKSKLGADDRVQVDSDSASSLPHRVMQMDIDSIQAAMAQNSAATIDQVVKALLGARRIVTIATRSAKTVGHFFAFNLAWILPHIAITSAAPDELCEHLLGLQKGDVAVAISITRYPRLSVEGLKLARERGATTVAITDSVVSPLAGVADLVLLAPGSLAGFADSFVAALSIINSVLVAASLANGVASKSALRDLESAWRRFGIFLRDSPSGTETPLDDH
jgi:DNA-binding MurR/RpiR family transcriptional regulator